MDPTRLARYYGAYDLYLSQHILAQPVSSLFVARTLPHWRFSDENLTTERSLRKTIGYALVYLLLISKSRGTERRGALWALRSTLVIYFSSVARDVRDRPVRLGRSPWWRIRSRL